MEEKQEKSEYSLKKDLITVIILTLIFCVVLVGLKIIDNQSGSISELASKIMSYIVR